MKGKIADFMRDHPAVSAAIITASVALLLGILNLTVPIIIKNTENKKSEEIKSLAVFTVSDLGFGKVAWTGFEKIRNQQDLKQKLARLRALVAEGNTLIRKDEISEKAYDAWSGKCKRELSDASPEIRTELKSIDGKFLAFDFYSPATVIVKLLEKEMNRLKPLQR